MASVLARARRKFAQQGLEAESTSIAQRAGSIYEILPASTPTLARAEGLNQDGTDFSYFIEIGIGSNLKPIYMLIDTGAGSTWVMSSTCQSSPCLIHQTFGPSDSETLEVEDTHFEIHYGSGSVSGLVASDTFHIAGFDLPFRFGLANVTSDDFNHFPFDGILGLGLSPGTTENFVAELVEEKLLDRNVFGVYLNRASDGDTGGEISFGSLNPDKYTGDITYTPLHKKDGYDWAIEMEDFSYGTKTAGVSTILSYIDTGTSYAFGPKKEVAKIYNMIDGATTSNGEIFNVPCDSNDELAITFSGRRHIISAKDWRSGPNENGQCTGNFYGYEVVANAWLLGDVFLKNVYAVFDVDKKQIGFGTRPKLTATTSAATTVISSPPGTVTQADDDISMQTTATADAANTITTAPTASSSERKRIDLLYPMLWIVVAAAAITT